MSSSSTGRNSLDNGPRAASHMDLSGHERDKLFLSRGAKDVVDVSYLSGADGVGDARVFAKADLDRDGFDDLIVVNRNAPLLQIYLDKLGPATKHHFVEVWLEGAHQVGARVTATGCGMTQTREVSLGSGFATVNGLAITLGLGTCSELDELVVKFAGAGERRTFKHVKADAFYRVVEGKGIQPMTFARTAAVAAPATPSIAQKLPGHAPLVLIDVFATWCEACIRTAPRLEALTGGIAALDVVGVTVEPTDDRAAVDRFAAAHQIAHTLLPYDAALAAAVDHHALPSTIILDRRTGAVVLETRGVPTRSDLERAISSQ